VGDGTLPIFGWVGERWAAKLSTEGVAPEFRSGAGSWRRSPDGHGRRKAPCAYLPRTRRGLGREVHARSRSSGQLGSTGIRLAHGESHRRGTRRLCSSARHVVAEFGSLTQDSGNVSWLVDTADVSLFVKTAGAMGEPPPDAAIPYLDHDGRVRLLRNAVDLTCHGLPSSEQRDPVTSPDCRRGGSTSPSSERLVVHTKPLGAPCVNKKNRILCFNDEESPSGRPPRHRDRHHRRVSTVADDLLQGSRTAHPQPHYSRDAYLQALRPTRTKPRSKVEDRGLWRCSQDRLGRGSPRIVGRRRGSAARSGAGSARTWAARRHPQPAGRCRDAAGERRGRLAWYRLAPRATGGGSVSGGGSLCRK
jgi:hypothetical protein